MPLILDGKKLAKEIEQRLHFEIIEGVKTIGRPPGLAVIRVGDDPASGIYVSNKQKACKRIGIKSFGEHFSANASTDEIVGKIEFLNANDLVDGILLQLPLPPLLDQVKLLTMIKPDKDADGLHSLNLGKLLKGEKGPRSCTPAGVMALLARNQIEIKGMRAVVVGRSILVGKPMALMLQAADATVSVAHSKTKDLAELTKQADLLVVAAGRPQIIGDKYVRKNSVVVDIGIHRVKNEYQSLVDSNKKLCGDVCFDEVSPLVSALTPVPGGVGPMTVAMLLVNTVNQWQLHCGLTPTLSDLLP